MPDALLAPIFSPPKGVLLLVGGVLIGFGTLQVVVSGHAISGLSNLQIPSLKAVIGFLSED
jgi:purine-cytosine permease-like protein